MKKMFVIVLCLTLTVGFNLCACDGMFADTEAKTTMAPTEFEVDLKITELLNNIKKDPYEYSNKSVTITGTIFISDSKVFLVNNYKLSLGSIGSNSVVKMISEILRDNPDRIEIRITSDLQRSVIENGDFAEVTGTVKIKDGEIYLDKCTCKILTTWKERDSAWRIRNPQ